MTETTPVTPRKRTGAKAKAKAAAAASSPEAAAADTPPAYVLKKKEFLDRVTALAGGKKKGTKEVADAVLTVLGEALAKGEELNLPPLGRAKVNRTRDNAGVALMMVKIRRGGPGGGKGKGKATEGDAAPADDSDD